MNKITEFEDRIGYQFNDQHLLEQALTHSSYAHERHQKGCMDNERLEFLGDAVLELVSSEFLYQQYPKMPEGDLTKLRASLVCEPTLAECTKQISLGDYLFLGKGEDHTGGRTRKSILSDAMEAVIGAVYLDGGFDTAKSFILRFILTDIEQKQFFHDSKTILQELVQGNFTEKLNYVLIDEKGPDHDKYFVSQARIGERVIGTGEGHTKKAAEQQAAYESLLILKDEVQIRKKR